MYDGIVAVGKIYKTAIRYFDFSDVVSSTSYL